MSIQNNLAEKSKRPVNAVIVGSGHRSNVCASYALYHPDELKITGVVEPNEVRRSKAAEVYGIKPEYCFESVDELLKHSGVGEAVINGTMDRLHVPTTLPLLEAGYHVLLEKPIGISQEEVLKLLECAREYKRKVMICHVLRYVPFYVEIRKRVAAGQVGEIISISTSENVSYHHMAVSYVRGKWSNSDLSGSSMLMSKCCHDLDIISWMKSGIAPVRVSSFGSLMNFRSDKAPDGAGTRCLTDCKIENECPYSAYKNYIKQDNRGFYAWEGLERIGEEITEEQKIESLRSDNPYGRCVWHCDNNVVDHQSVIIEYSDGCTASHNMIGGSSKPGRSIHIIGTKGEIQGVMEDGCFTVRHPDPRKGHEFSEEMVNIEPLVDKHISGDHGLVKDFVNMLRGEEPSISTTTLEDSIYGHIAGFSADKAMMNKTVVEIEKI